MSVFGKSSGTLLATACILCCMKPCSFGKTYLLDPVRREWDESKAHCDSKCMDLVTVSSYYDYNKLVEFLNREGVHTRHAWLGLRLPENSSREEDYEWIDGTKLTWTNWDQQEKEPSSMCTSKCVVIRNMDRMTYDTKSCLYTYYTVCQKKDLPVFDRLHEIHLNSVPFLISSTRSRIECSTKCNSAEMCNAFTVKRGMCSLYDVDETQYIPCTDYPCNTYRRRRGKIGC